MKEAASCWSKISFTGRLEKKAQYKLYSIADIGVVCPLHEEFGLIAMRIVDTKDKTKDNLNYFLYF
jgi:trehalose-6-phosphate synthase